MIKKVKRVVKAQTGTMGFRSHDCSFKHQLFYLEVIFPTSRRRLSCLLGNDGKVIWTELHISSQEVAFTDFSQSLATVLSFPLCKALLTLIIMKPVTCVLDT